MTSLLNLIHDETRPIDPQPTGMKPVLKRLHGIKALVFDVYGTLFVSGSGDIGIAEEAGREAAMREALKSIGAEVRDEGVRSLEIFIQAIRRDHSESPHPHPEVDIRDIWRSTVEQLLSQGALEGSHLLDGTKLDHAAIYYECKINPVWPMPDAEEILEWAKGKYELGIVSNAQFFTPLLFEAFFKKKLTELGLDPHLSVWSYMERHAKPGRELYEKLLENLEDSDVSAAEALYIGNDMRNDIWPAAECGFKTALFAGDKRSLRLREDMEEIRGVKPDLVITELTQLRECLD